MSIEVGGRTGRVCGEGWEFDDPKGREQQSEAEGGADEDQAGEFHIGAFLWGGWMDVSFAWDFLGVGKVTWVKSSERGWNRTRAKGALAVQET